MKVLIAGGTGFIGQKLTEQLMAEGHEVVILSRKNSGSSVKGVSYVTWLQDGTAPESELELEQIDAVINLAGVSINDGRWTNKHQQQIYQSRMIATDELVRIVSLLARQPIVWINASAIGIYPASIEHTYTEASTRIADDFLGKTVRDWERKAGQVADHGIRTVYMRFGVVLSRQGGALPLISLPYRLFAGGTVGSGEQWVSWVHIDDVVRAILFSLQNQRLSGPVNVTAPTPLKMKEFGKTMGRVLNRPHWLPVPSFIMRSVLGQKSKLVLEGQYVVPDVLLKERFEFAYPTLEHALQALWN